MIAPSLLKDGQISCHHDFTVVKWFVALRQRLRVGAGCLPLHLGHPWL